MYFCYLASWLLGKIFHSTTVSTASRGVEITSTTEVLDADDFELNPPMITDQKIDLKYIHELINWKTTSTTTLSPKTVKLVHS